MTRLTYPLALMLTLGLGSLALAQTTPAEPATDAPATDAAAAEVPAAEPAAPGTEAAPDALAIGTEVATDGPGSTYVPDGGVFTDWELRCIRTEDGKDPCQLYQLLKDGEGNAVAQVSMFALPAGQQAVAGATVVTPLETLLTEDLVIQVDAGKAKRYPFSWCDPSGCIARIGFTAEDLAALKKGNKATVTIVPVGAPDQKVNLNLSLKGFTAGYEAVAKAPQ